MIHIFVSCSLYYWIPQIFKIFWKVRFESIFVCVWQTVWIRRSSCCYLMFKRITSTTSPSQWRRNQSSAGPWVEPGLGRPGMRLWRPIEARNWRGRIRRTPRTTKLWIRRQRIWEIWAIRWARRKWKARWWT